MSGRIGTRRLTLLFAVVLFFFSSSSRAQDTSDEAAGVDSGNYNIKQTAELGYRATWINGNQDTYDTFVNLNSGPRLLNYTLDVRSLNHTGLLFDNLNFSNFGYGGDPDDVSRLRVEKNKRYEFSVVFRRHKNFWDYNLLANPLNPIPIAPTGAPSSFAITNPSFASTQSPHSLNLVRRMQDYDLTLLPQSRVRFRLGYSNYADEGPALSTYHGTDLIPLAENFRMTTNAYRAGVDFRFLPETTISYDQFLQWDKNDTSDTLANTPSLVQTTQFPGTLPVNMGIVWSYPPNASTAPCTAPFLSTGYANTACPMLESYTMTGPARNFMPTERLSFQSTYFKRFEMSGSASYSSSKNVVSNLFDSANEWTASTTSLIRDAIVSGPALAKELFVHANWSGIYSLTQKVRIIDTVNYDQWQNPGYAGQVSTNLFATGAQATGQTGILLPTAGFSPLVAGGPTFASICPGPYTATTCPQHTTSASADVSDTSYVNFMGQRLLSNTIQLEADLTKRITGRIGYLYENRQIGEIDSFSTPVYSIYYPGGPSATPANDYLAARGSCANYNSATGVFSPAAGTCVQNADGSVTYTNPPTASVPRTLSTIDEQVGLAGLTLRPMDTLRIDSDFEFGYNSYSYTRIWPRQIQSYKIHVNYRPRTWAIVDGAVDIHENRDNVSQVDNLEHGRTYSVSMMLAPNSKISYTLGYDYSDIYLETFICFDDTFGTMNGTALPTFETCPISNTTSNNTQGAMGFYSSKQHYAYSDVMWKPVKQVTASLGYAGTFVGGSTLLLNPLQPAGTLAFNYHMPFVSVQIDYKGISYKTTWNYYGYNGKAPVNISVPINGGTLALEPIGAPDFNGSTLMFAMRYAF